MDARLKLAAEDSGARQDLSSSLDRRGWAERYADVRAYTLKLAANLSPEDQQIQSMPDTSPTKWHLAHTAWFFETFLLTPSLSGYQPLDARFGYLFNSYYEAVGERHARPERGLITRPSSVEVIAYRAHVDAAMARLIETADSYDWPMLRDLIELGLHHEQQHQELILMDIKHAFSRNPMLPAYRAASLAPSAKPTPLDWRPFEGGLREIGHDAKGFAFDNEGPRHKVWLEPFHLASRLSTAAEYLAFMRDGGYSRAELWLSDGWASVQREGWRAPLYWRETKDGWQVFTLEGERAVDPDQPVSHLSFYEADAFARWSDGRLPTEAEWEVAAASDDHLSQMSDGLWQWTASAYLPYPGFKTAEGAVGEYNGKFMSGQMVLRGGASVTSPGHTRITYRNFFPPRPAGPFQASGWHAMFDTDEPTVGLSPSEPRIRFHDYARRQESFAEAVAKGLSGSPKSIPARFLYDAQGSALFDRICELPEYYPTRTEMQILRDHAAEIAARMGPEAMLVELGSGSSVKVRLLLDAMTAPAAYAPIDISREHLIAAAEALAADYPEIEVTAVCADYSETFPLPPSPSAGAAGRLFPGSTIGNLEPDEAQRFLAGWASSGVDMVVGVDLVKDRSILEPAYNDAQGVTASFSLNVLARANRELGADFDPSRFAHRSRWNAEDSRIQIHIESLADQSVRVDGESYDFRAGEHIETEHSYKYSVDGFQALARRAGYAPAEVWTDDANLFSVHYLTAGPG